MSPPMYMVSPLRYPGAKWRLCKFVESLLRRNDLMDGSYAEPYAGGASLALSLLLRYAVTEIRINDLDRSIYAFWKCVVEANEELIKKIKKTPITVRVWKEQKLIQKNKKSADLFDLGFSTFFLNRTNRSGILNAGIIGGKEQKGKWKIDARFNKDELISRIKKIGQFKSQIKVTNLDALKFLKRIETCKDRKLFIYLDPPYFCKGPDLYYNHYKSLDHVAVSDCVINKVSHPWMVSYDNHLEIRRLYKKIRSVKYKLNYSASTRRDGDEILFFSNSMSVPPLN